MPIGSPTEHCQTALQRTAECWYSALEQAEQAIRCVKHKDTTFGHQDEQHSAVQVAQAVPCQDADERREQDEVAGAEAPEEQHHRRLPHAQRSVSLQVAFNMYETYAISVQASA